MNPPATPPATSELTERRLAEIRRVVADHYSDSKTKIDRAALTSQRRDEPLATIRQMAMVIARELTDATLQKIACSFARRDHGTVMHAIIAIPAKIETSAVLRVEFGILKGKCAAALEGIK